MKLLRFNQQPLEIPSEIILDVNYHSPNVLEVTTTENTVELGYCLRFDENEPRPLNIACYKPTTGWSIIEWFINPDKVDRIIAADANLHTCFKDDNKRNACNACRFC